MQSYEVWGVRVAEAGMIRRCLWAHEVPTQGGKNLGPDIPAASIQSRGGRPALPRLSPADDGKYVLIDIETVDYEIDQDEIAASDRLLARHPDAQVWMRQVGSRYARRLRAAMAGEADSRLTRQAIAESRTRPSVRTRFVSCR